MPTLHLDAQRNIFRLALVILIALLLMGYSMRNSVSSTSIPTAGPFIGEQQAIKVALDIAALGVKSEMVEPPTGAHGELMTLRTAEGRLGIVTSVSNAAPPPDTMVWFVTVDGSWLIVGGPISISGTPYPTPPPHHHFFVIINAKTGRALEWEG